MQYVYNNNNNTEGIKNNNNNKQIYKAPCTPTEGCRGAREVGQTVW